MEVTLTPTLREAAKRVSDEYTRSAKAHALDDLEAKFERALVRWLNDLRRRILLATTGPGQEAFRTFYAERPLPALLPLSEKAVPLSLARSFDAIVDSAEDVFLGTANEHIADAWEAGFNNGKPIIGNVGTGLGAGQMTTMFALADRQATDWAKKYSANMVKGVTDMTKLNLRSLVVAAKQEGASYATLARNIAGADSLFGRSRAKMIAVTELAFAYEEGHAEVARTLHDAGIPMEKEWLTHSQPCSVCQPNRDAGWLDIDAAFPSGHNNPPAHPRCRCSAAFRRTPGADRKFVDTEPADAKKTGPSTKPEDYKTIQSADRHTEHDSWGFEHYRSSKWATTAEQESALDYFQGNGYRVINADYKAGRTNVTGRQVEEALRVAPPVPEDITLWRGATTGSMKGKQVGDLLERKVFSSTSVNENTAHNFLSGYMESERVLWRILTPAGTRNVGYVDAVSGKMMGESEMLFAPGSKWRIVADEVTERTYYLGVGPNMERTRKVRMVTVVVEG